MTRHRYLPRRNREILAGLLVLALLLTQWSGFQHRITHGGGQGSSSYSLAAGAASNFGEAGDPAHHSCIAFDIATLAVTVHSPGFAASLLSNQDELTQGVAFASHRPPFSCHFLSRAPPSA